MRECFRTGTSFAGTEEAMAAEIQPTPPRFALLLNATYTLKWPAKA